MDEQRQRTNRIRGKKEKEETKKPLQNDWCCGRMEWKGKKPNWSPNK